MIINSVCFYIMKSIIIIEIDYAIINFSKRHFGNIDVDKYKLYYEVGLSILI